MDLWKVCGPRSAARGTAARSEQTRPARFARLDVLAPGGSRMVLLWPQDRGPQTPFPKTFLFTLLLRP
jgi:hypothetical protein